MVARNDASTCTCVLNFIWYHNINFSQKAKLLVDISIFSIWLWHFFTNLHERYRFFPYLKRQGKFDISREGPSSGSNFHQKVEFFLVERSYTFRVLLNALRTYTGNLRSRYFNKLQSLYNHFFSIGLILFCLQLVYCANRHSIGGHPSVGMPLL